MRDIGSRPQVDALLDGSMDLGFIRMPVRNAGLMTSVVLREDMLIAVGNSGKSSRPLTLEDIRDEPFVLIGRSTSSTLYNHAFALCSRAGMGVSLLPCTAQ